MATERLSMRQTREILRQKWSLGRTHREVAQSLRSSSGTVGTTVLRARAAGRAEERTLSSSDFRGGSGGGQPKVVRQPPSESSGARWRPDSCGNSERLFRSPLPMPAETGNNRGPVSFRLVNVHSRIALAWSKYM